MKKFLQKTGLENIYQLVDFIEKKITLRDGRKDKLFAQPSAVDALPYPKLSEKSEVSKKINKLLKKTNKKYYKLMDKNLCGDCLVFKGQKL